MEVCDISPGTELVAGSSGWQYTVASVSDGTVTLQGPRGPLTTTEEELQREIAEGNVVVRS